jgi:hypothetical protein
VKLPKLRVPTIDDLRRIPWRRITTWRALPWALAVVFLATTLTNWWFLRHERADDARTRAVETTSREFLDALTNFTAKSIDRDVTELRSFAIGDFTSQIDQTFSGARIAQIKRAKVSSTGHVQTVFVESLNGSSATALGVVNTTITNNVTSGARTEVLRAELGLIDTTDGWRISSVNILQTPSQSGP